MAKRVRPWQVKPFLHRERKAREGDQEPASIFHQGQRHRRTKVRMYGCNLYLLAVMRLSAWQTGGDHVCVKTLEPPMVQCILGHVGSISRDFVDSNRALSNPRGMWFEFCHGLGQKWTSA